MNIDLTEKWAKEIALMSDAEFEENCKHIETLLKRRKQALRIHDVSGQVCPLCHGRGEYHIGGSFGGNVEIVRCNCGQTLR